MAALFAQALNACARMPSRKRTAEQAQAQANVLRLMANALRFTGETESAKLKLMEARPRRRVPCGPWTRVIHRRRR